MAAARSEQPCPVCGVVPWERGAWLRFFEGQACAAMDADDVCSAARGGIQRRPTRLSRPRSRNFSEWRFYELHKRGSLPLVWSGHRAE
jgi:hypothetical protein